MISCVRDSICCVIVWFCVSLLLFVFVEILVCGVCLVFELFYSFVFCVVVCSLACASVLFFVVVSFSILMVFLKLLYF